LAGGFLGGFVQTGTLKGGLNGLITAGLFYGAGSIDQGLGLSFGGSIMTHAVAGCVSSEVSGGKCGQGAMSAGFAEAAGPFTQGLGQTGDLVAHSVVGGTASVLGGGKFENGAMTGAYGYLFNELQHVTFDKMKTDVKAYLDDQFFPKVKDFFALLNDNGINPTVTDAFRTDGDQQDRLNSSNYGPAKVGSSLHEAGFAIDININAYTPTQQDLIVNLADKAGLSWGGDFKKYDPVHFYYDPGNRAALIRDAQNRYRGLNSTTH